MPSHAQPPAPGGSGGLTETVQYCTTVHRQFPPHHPEPRLGVFSGWLCLAWWEGRLYSRHLLSIQARGRCCTWCWTWCCTWYCTVLGEAKLSSGLTCCSPRSLGSHGFSCPSQGEGTDPKIDRCLVCPAAGEKAETLTKASSRPFSRAWQYWSCGESLRRRIRRCATRRRR